LLRLSRLVLPPMGGGWAPRTPVVHSGSFFAQRSV